jgi:lysine 6-dehydrogenase
MEKKNVTVLGAGLVGAVIATDLSTDFSVTAVDSNAAALAGLKDKKNIRTIRADLTETAMLQQSVKDADIVVGALPGSMGYKTLKTLVAEKKDIVDISFFPEDPFPLDSLARENNITLITDCGVAPGMGNIILAHHNGTMAVDSFECYVGGLPVVREWPWEYKAVFSPMDVIEEYTRPARYIANGQMVEREALSDPQLLFFEGIGSLEAWNSDGLRTLIKTMNIPNMIEKTLRYPGCIEYLRVLRKAGFFSYEKVDIDGMEIRPIDLTARLLFPDWKLKPGEEDFTVMRIIISGTEVKPAGKGKGTGKAEAAGPKEYVWDMLDRYDRSTGTISMARTTGYTCTAAVRLVAGGMFTRKGLCPPEYLGEEEGNFWFIIKHLEDRGVKYRMTTR